MVKRLPWSPASCEGVVHGVGIGGGIRTNKANLAQCPAARPPTRTHPVALIHPDQDSSIANGAFFWLPWPLTHSPAPRELHLAQCPAARPLTHTRAHTCMQVGLCGGPVRVVHHPEGAVHRCVRGNGGACLLPSTLPWHVHVRLLQGMLARQGGGEGGAGGEDEEAAGTGAAASSVRMSLL